MEITKRELYDFKDRVFPKKICFNPIGIIHTEFETLRGIPIQFSMSDTKGVIEIFPQYQDGLNHLEGFSHIYCIYFFDLVKLPVPLKSKPFLFDKNVGVFSMRTPFRPNPIGISVFEILEIKQNTIKVNNVDILDQTPILDIKPYISEFDCRKSLSHGWIENKIRKMTS